MSTMSDMSMFDIEYGVEMVGHDMLLFGSSYSSPAVPTVHDPTHAPSASTNQGTVSPKDLVRDRMESAPNSVALTNLTSPSVFDTPELNDDFETSPLFTSECEISTTGQDPWFSLFPTPESTESPANRPVELNRSFSSTGEVSSPRPSPPQSAPMSRGPSGRHSSVSGVNSRRRDKPLPPILIDQADAVAAKRARNTLAARKSRQRKLERFEELENEIAQLKADRDHWKELALRVNNGQI